MPHVLPNRSQGRRVREARRAQGTCLESFFWCRARGPLDVGMYSEYPLALPRLPAAAPFTRREESWRDAVWHASDPNASKLQKDMDPPRKVAQAAAAGGSPTNGRLTPRGLSELGPP